MSLPGLNRRSCRRSAPGRSRVWTSWQRATLCGMDRVLAGRYRLLHRLGAGGMSVVWRAHDDVLDREVAVKVLATERATDPGLADRVRVEARGAGPLRQPQVVEVHQ
jgi:serine/threonine protein kinase